MYRLSEQTLADYREKVVEKVGEKVEMDIHDQVAQKKVLDKPVESSEVIITNNSEVLFLEPITGRYFQSDMETVRRAVNTVNSTLHQDLFATLDDFFYEIDLPPTRISSELGWNADKLMDIHFSTTLAEDNRPCIVLEYVNMPYQDHMRKY